MQLIQVIQLMVLHPEGVCEMQVTGCQANFAHRLSNKCCFGSGTHMSRTANSKRLSQHNGGLINAAQKLPCKFSTLAVKYIMLKAV